MNKDHSERLFLSVRSAVSGRHAILEDNGFSVILYLTEATSLQPVADCFVYSVAAPIEELVSPHGTSGPPILMQSHASDVAWQPDVAGEDHRLEFSADGHSVAVFVRGVPWALIARDERRGYSKCIAVTGPFGEPWSQELFDSLFFA